MRAACRQTGGKVELFLRRGRTARRKPGQALVPTEAGRLPTIYLAETAKPKRELLPVYLCEAGQEEASHRLKWLASTCLAGMVGVCLIGFAVYASMNMSDGKGMVSSIKQASLAALKPMRSATLARDGQSATVEKGDRIQLSASGFTSPRRDPRDGGRAPRLPRIHHHQALPSHRSRTCHCQS